MIRFHPVIAPTRTVRRGAMRTGALVFGLVLWLIVGALLLFGLKRQPEPGPDARTNAENAAPSADAMNTTIREAADKPTAAADSDSGSDEEPVQDRSVRIGFPASPLPDFEFDEAQGKRFGLKDLKGRRWVASFLFTRCQSTCPTIARAVMETQQRVATDAPDVVFVTFTVDPDFDSADILRRYSEIFQADPERWKFLTGPKEELFEIIVYGLGQYVKENVGEMRLPGFEVAHSNRVVLVNEDGIPVGTFLGTVPGDMLELQRILMGKKEFPQPGPAPAPAASPLGSDGIQFQAVPKDNDDSPGGDSAEQPQSEEPSTAGFNTKPDYLLTSAATEDNGTPPVTSEETGTRTSAEINAAIDAQLPNWVRPLPAVNAGLNTLSTLLLITGFRAIRRGNKLQHRNLMISAFVVSVVFLGSYLVYHYLLGRYTGEHGRRFIGSTAATVAYYCLLIPHVILAAAVPVLAILTFRHAFAGRWDKHRRIAAVTFPIWMFVSVTGIVIYGMLYHWPA